MKSGGTPRKAFFK